MKRIMIAMVVMVYWSSLLVADSLTVSSNPWVRFDWLVSQNESGPAMEFRFHRFVVGGIYLPSITGLNFGYRNEYFTMKCGMENLTPKKNSPDPYKDLSASLTITLGLRFKEGFEIEAYYSDRKTTGLALRYQFEPQLALGIGYLRTSPPPPPPPPPPSPLPPPPPPN